MVVLRLLAAAAATLAWAGAAQAHVALQPTTATAGSYQVLRFGVGHGCDGKATTAVRIEMPAGLGSARPQPKPGWRLALEQGPDATVRAVVWQGELSADQFDEFLVQVKLPAAEGRLSFPAIQSCGATVVRWSEAVPTDGLRPKYPAPSLTLTPADAPPPEGGHDHHH